MTPRGLRVYHGKEEVRPGRPKATLHCPRRWDKTGTEPGRAPQCKCAHCCGWSCTTRTQWHQFPGELLSGRKNSSMQGWKKGEWSRQVEDCVAKSKRIRGLEKTKQRLGTHPELLSQRQNKANILSEIIYDECLRRFGLIGKRKSFSWWRNEGLFVRLGKRWRQMRRKVRKPYDVKSRAA